jgi:DNA-binding beta-propeller fold protein YncE
MSLENTMTKTVKWTALLVAAGFLGAIGCAQQGTRIAEGGVPRYEVDALWPKPLQGNWLLGQVSSVAVDRHDHVWILHRPATLLPDEKGALAKPPANRCCTPAPAVLEFDQAGNLVQAWGGPGEGYDWPKNEHGIHVDAQDHVWISGNDDVDNHILKFTREGKFLLQIGKPGKSEGSNARAQLGRPAAIESYAAANEIFVGDGYGNHRVIVFDATTGAYKRHWGAYGAVPSDDKMPAYKPGAPASKQFGNPHCVRIARDGLVYVCDRPNNRVQVFRPDGTYLREFFVEAGTLTGPVADLVTSRDAAERFLFVADGSNSEVHILARDDGRKLGSFGRPGRMAGEFRNVHNMAIDSAGNIYTAEVGSGRRVQRFTPR